MPGLLSKLLSVGSEKELRNFRKIVGRINDLRETYADMSDDDLRAQTDHFRERYEQGEELESMLPEAFAVVREAAGRSLGMRHFDVQLMGGIALHRGMIAEMKTGEGKTLVSTLPGYLNAIAGEGVHIVTVNDYLAKRDFEWMGRVYGSLGITLGLLQNGMKSSDKFPAYQADITYGTNSEFGFDYLRDNMVGHASMRVQRGHHYAIVDEVDSILIDEARTPLIISGAGTRSASTYKSFARAVRGLVSKTDFEMDEAKHTIAATEAGLSKVEHALNIDIYADMSGQLVNHLQQALRAEYMFHRDQQYVVIDGEVKIVDEFTGRIMEGRRYSDGLHQAIEAKEGVLVREENQTLATITLQNYFRLYEKLSGMTGTAMTEDSEFRQIYNLPVQVIPSNKPLIRVDEPDRVYINVDAKFEAVAQDVEARHEQGQPVLVGTVSIESSERLSRILNKRGIAHQVLNAKFHEREAAIIAQAGRQGAVTIATNMAGRGTDILLGGNPEVLAEETLRTSGLESEQITEDIREAALDEARVMCEQEREHVIATGGLVVIGTERHESRRIDNQLRGRSGRQGDPGETVFYVSLRDDIMRLFGKGIEHLVTMAENLAEKHNELTDLHVQTKMVSKKIADAQRRVEESNFAMRKSVLEYDDVMNEQRKAIYEERNKILDGKDLLEHSTDLARDLCRRKVDEFCPEDLAYQDWDIDELKKWLRDLTGVEPDFSRMEDPDLDSLAEMVQDHVMQCFERKSEHLGAEAMSELSAQVMLRVIDTRWMSYLQEMDYLKMGIGLRGFGQRDPLVEYKSEAYLAFNELIHSMYEDYLRTILRLEVEVVPEPEPTDQLQNATYSGPAEIDGANQVSDLMRLHEATGGASGAAVGGSAAQDRASADSQGTVRTYRKADDPNPYVGVGRNDPCPCGSGKKFKNCHGRSR